MEISFEAKVSATKEKIWDFYANLQNWYLWEEDLEDITLDGDFQTGAKGMMKLTGMPPMEYTLTEVVENAVFCDKTPTPIGEVYFDHRILERADGVYVRHSVRLETANPNAEALGFLRQIFADVPDSIMLLKAKAEQ